jgi:hemolysin III
MPPPNKTGTAGRRHTARGHEFGIVGRYIRDPFPALSHGLGALLALAATLVLLRAELHATPSPEPARLAALAVYGVTLILLLSTSAWAHTAITTEKASQWWVRLDYAAIFLLIAGTYTPVCVLAIGGTPGWGILAAQWALAGLGIWGVLAGWCRTALRVGLYIAMGWLGLLIPTEVVRGVGWNGIAWLVAGGVVYTLGAVVYVTDRPRLFPGIFVAHDLWHLMVLLGAALHFVAVWGIVIARAN